MKEYAWGSVSAIPELLGAPATGAPQAELWLGGHAAGPSMLADGSFLDEHVAGLGELDDYYAGQLPFLMKVLAAESPLSIQAHPDRRQAVDGFARENAAGVAVGDPARNYKDRHHKPEILVAVTPFSALCGFRDPRRSALLLQALLGDGAATGEVAARLLGLLEDGDLRGAAGFVLSGDPEMRRFAVRLAAAAQGAGDPLGQTIRFVAGHYGDDPGVVMAALMNRVDLEPGEAFFLDAGQLHAYLCGVGIEAMAPSDNVLRGGLTPKHVDVGELQRVVAFEVSGASPVAGERCDVAGGSLVSYRPPVEEFEVHRLTTDGGPVAIELPGPALLVVTRGTLRLVVDGVATTVGHGGCGFVDPGAVLEVEALAGPAEAYLTTSPGLSVRQFGTKRL
ncbi:MAG TPA: mannose-6-phosphate isomerase, class I [Arachnia sp.]|nr:mannose-6-phosphate isomerase, class I [Arachnia sp.]HMT87327.1 mannose-6-phosphate isomerase, class I [Arachnia sp.]